jgi:hypothetical protein
MYLVGKNEQLNEIYAFHRIIYNKKGPETMCFFPLAGKREDLVG